MTAFALVGLLTLGLLVAPVLQALAEQGHVRILGRPTGPSGLLKLGLFALFLGCVVVEIVVSVLKRLDPRHGE